MSKTKRRDDCPAYLRAGVHEKTIAIDLDGTVFEGTGCKEIGVPIAGAIERMSKLKASGYYIIIHTARINDECEAVWGPQLSKIEMALHAADCPYNEIWQGRGKPIACYQIDDRSYVTVAAFCEKIKWREICGA